MKQKSVAIIGAGIGGMCAAARLAKHGYSVDVYEQNPQVGGRAYKFSQDGFSFDMGPTLLMMTDVLYDTFKYCGKNFDDYIELIQLEPNYQVVFGDHSRIEVSSNLPRFCNQLAKFDSKAPEQFYHYFGRVAEFYRLARKHYIDKNFDKPTDFLSPKHGVQLLTKRGLSSLYNFTGHYFRDERLRQLFSFQSMYLGVSPYDAPAIYSTVSYMETGLGIWYPKGGMYKLSQALKKLCIDMGVKIHLNSQVEKINIENGVAQGITLKPGNAKQFDMVLANSDLVYTYLDLVDAKHRPSMPEQKLTGYKQASSALLFYWGLDAELDGLLHHNVILSKQFKQNLEQIFKEGKLPTDPSFYVYVPTKTDPTLAPKGRHVMYVLVPVPNLEANIDWQEAAPGIKAKVLKRFEKEFGVSLKNSIRSERIFGPNDFASTFNLHQGSAFGLSHNLFQSGYFRPSNKSRDVAGLYFVGASTYPGGGIPMVTLSAKLVVERILEEQP